MNSETVSNLVTAGAGSEAAQVKVDEPSLKRARPATFYIWNFFRKFGPDKDGVERSKCKGCKKVFKAGGKRYGTSTLKRHLDSCTQIKHEDIGQNIAKLQNKMGALKIDAEAEVKSGKNQLDIYLSEAILFYNDAIIDVLQWWKDNHDVIDLHEDED
ncbi:hypothetical protein Ahy_B06g082508 [Arachis hypogaea]|uniref:BED-type domain-containing protein n=1 Tax=Arachis hypogaea TaxID=3818 RepID=A0A444YNI4_ARAHY|nr:hypothetical protein Ahy_B06g082508 [Arachis hypogaea]